MKQVHLFQGVKHMGAGRKKTLIIVAGLVTLIVIAIVIALLLFDINSFKSKIETTASGITGLDVRINGKMHALFLSLRPIGKGHAFCQQGR